MRTLPRIARLAFTAVWAGMLTFGLLGGPGVIDTALATGETTVTKTVTETVKDIKTVTATVTVKDIKTVTETVTKSVTDTVTTTVKDIKTVTDTVTKTVTTTVKKDDDKEKCNSGNGNGSETNPANDCDPGNSGGHNNGKD